jgi:hypothetical protein
VHMTFTDQKCQLKIVGAHYIAPTLFFLFFFNFKNIFIFNPIFVELIQGGPTINMF